jgi:hypothetical protein
VKAESSENRWRSGDGGGVGIRVSLMARATWPSGTKPVICVTKGSGLVAYLAFSETAELSVGVAIPESQYPNSAKSGGFLDSAASPARHLISSFFSGYLMTSCRNFIAQANQRKCLVFMSMHLANTVNG